MKLYENPLLQAALDDDEVGFYVARCTSNGSWVSVWVEDPQDHVGRCPTLQSAQEAGKVFARAGWEVGMIAELTRSGRKFHKFQEGPQKDPLDSIYEDLCAAGLADDAGKAQYLDFGSW